MPGTIVVSDALACFGAVVDAKCLHEPSVVGRAKPRELPQFQWVNTVLGNLKRTFAGAHHSFKFHKYAASYLAGFAYRFNHRFDLKGLVACLIVDVARSEPKTQRTIRKAEPRF